MKTETMEVQALLEVPQALAWLLYTAPMHIKKWNFANEDWRCPQAETELKDGGKFSYRMEAKDGSMGFDYSGTFDMVNEPDALHITLDDGRKVVTTFAAVKDGTLITTRFETDGSNSRELQQQGWQAIHNNYKRYAESYARLQTIYFEIDINATKEEVWEKMLYRPGYNEWTAEFSPGSDYEGSWEKGSDIYFCVTNAEGVKEGMVSHIIEHIANQQVVIEHRGVLVNGEPITEGPATMGWAGAKEIYTLEKSLDGITKVKVAVDVNQPYLDFFNTAWPKALQKLKEIAEA